MAQTPPLGEAAVFVHGQKHDAAISCSVAQGGGGIPFRPADIFTTTPCMGAGALAALISQD
jgi:hypothetical protein